MRQKALANQPPLVHLPDRFETQGDPALDSTPDPTAPGRPAAGAAPLPPEAVAGRVLVVDLDGTLIRSDMLHESFWSAASSDWRVPGRAIVGLSRGRAALKADLASRAHIIPAELPYNPEVLARIDAWRAAGGRTALVTATDARLASQIATHLGIFDEVHGSDGSRNLKGEAKAAFLVDRFGRGGFVYIGDSSADLAVWREAAGAITVGASDKTRAALKTQGIEAEHLDGGSGGMAAMFKALRPHQWLKNLLVLVPVIADPGHGAGALLPILAALVALSLCASAGYVLNDLLDLADDRSHPRKCKRPFASGALSAATGTFMVPALLLTGLAVALSVSPALFGVAALYFVSTMAYSVKLKRHAIVDICVLAFLFTLRIIAGGAAVGIGLSVWLLAFSMFTFFALAAVKRLGEMSEAGAAGREVSRRGYRVEDRPLLSQMAIASGYLAVLVLALYVDQPDVQEKYATPWLLWGVCPMLIFWISRMTLVASRGEMDDDPLVWTLENRTSRMTVLIISALIAGALWV